MNCVVEDNYTIKDVMESFEKNYERAALVANKNHKIMGIVSQGDIIRALVSGMDIYTNVSQIAQPSFLYLNERDMEKAYQIFRKNNISMLPVVDRNFELIDVITITDIYDYLEDRR